MAKEPIRKLLVPVPGRRVKDPFTLRLIPDTGAILPITSFWERRLRDGDVIEGQAPAPEILEPKPSPARKGKE